MSTVLTSITAKVRLGITGDQAIALQAAGNRIDGGGGHHRTDAHIPTDTYGLESWGGAETQGGRETGDLGGAAQRTANAGTVLPEGRFKAAEDLT